ncbi:trehalose-phosphatase [Candidatus Bipolaricaulota bacterium]|nr:trehalose-phosphatase [Candidatus Bipolaricaulota bacterium]
MTDLKNPNERTFWTELTQSVEESGKLLLSTDFDGTLVDFTGVPSDTELPENTEDLLNQLGGVDNLHLAVISGRGFEELTELVPIENATLAGNHGLKIRFEDGTTRNPEMGKKIKATITSLKREVRKNFGDLEGIIIEDKVFGLALHYRQYSGNEEEVEEGFYDIWENHRIPLLEVIEGAKLLEVRPARWNKGDAVQLLRERFGKPPTLYIGDDTTDEDAFAALKEANSGFPILVSEKTRKATEARYLLHNPKEVHRFLGDLYENFSGILSALGDGP